MKRRQSVARNERGMISFMVTTVLVLVVGLILVGFSQAARRNQRETLDRQLSTQAFYAAESGVNTVASVIKNSMDASTPLLAKNTCPGNSTYPNSQLSPGVEVTCILVDASLDSLSYSDVNESKATFVPIVSANGALISEVTIRWQSKTGSTTPAQGCPTSMASLSLPARGAYPASCDYGVIRADLTNSISGNTNQFAMSQFFKPIRIGGSSTVAYAPGGGSIRGATCDNTRCESTIINLSGAVYYMRLRSIYRDASVIISAKDAAGNTVPLSGQALVDVTAKAQDVLRRIQVRLPLHQSQSIIPEYGIESTQSICKRFSVAPDFYDEDSAVAAECN